MQRHLDVLDNVRIASPCTADWEAMKGDDRVRHCKECALDVYNLSAMTREQASALVEEREGRLCVAFYRRPDGTMLTRDCPVGLALVRQKARRAAARVIGLAAALIGLVLVRTRWPGGELIKGLAEPARRNDVASPMNEVGESRVAGAMSSQAPQRLMGTPSPLVPGRLVLTSQPSTIAEGPIDTRLMVLGDVGGESDIAP